MIDQIPDFYIALILITFLATSIAKYISLKRVVSRLKQIDLPRYIEMGSPEPSFFRRFSDYTTARTTNSGAVLNEFTDLSTWLSKHGYERLNDYELTSNVKRYQFLGYVQLAICIPIAISALYSRFAPHH